MSPWRVALTCSLPVLLVLLGGISLAAWKEHEVKRREMKKRSKEYDQMLLMVKGTKAALKVRGMNGNRRISHGLWKCWGLGELEKHGMQGFHEAPVLQRTKAGGHQTSELWPQTTAFTPCSSQSHALPTPILHPSPRPPRPSFSAPTLLQKVLPVLRHRVLFLRINQERV